MVTEATNCKKPLTKLLEGKYVGQLLTCGTQYIACLTPDHCGIHAVN